MAEKLKQEKRIIPVAYVTKWAASRGILVVHSGEYVPRDGGDDGYLSKGVLFVHPNNWTDDKDVAVSRWRKALNAKIASHKKAIAKLGEALMGDAPFKEK